MTTQPADQLHRRASKLALAATSSTLARTHLNEAMTHAVSARADLALIGDLKTALDAITRVIKRAELQRQRLQRKADRQGATP
jgi:hypothetical protein